FFLSSFFFFFFFSFSFFFLFFSPFSFLSFFFSSPFVNSPLVTFLLPSSFFFVFFFSLVDVAVNSAYRYVFFIGKIPVEL
ncbi:hypothetical protein, partial [Staphylococcus aureus]|uniref:hypothetical protein n=1 Tax=Staphylococcus aureus TaxID=1280 RepID=UPI001C1F866B